MMLAFISAGTLAAAPLIGGCEIGYSFRGPAFDQERGLVDLDPDRVLFVAFTQGDIAPGSTRRFSEALRHVLADMDAHDGLVGYSVRRQLFGARVWTMSAWTDRQALRRFLASSAHRAAVRDGGIPRESVVYAFLEVPAREVPVTWPRAKAVLAEASQEEATR